MQTKTGAAMNLELKERIVAALSLAEHEGKTQKEIAKIINVSTRTVQNYLTKDVWEEIHKRRLDVINHSLKLVDQAVYQKALKGDMSAARILYSRWDHLKNCEELKQDVVHEENDIAEIKRLEKQIQELEYEQNPQAEKAET